MKQSESGFTLVELLVTMSLIGILAALALPTFVELKLRAIDARKINGALSVRTALETHFIDTNTYPPNPNPGRACTQAPDNGGFTSAACLTEIEAIVPPALLQDTFGGALGRKGIWYYNYGGNRGAVVHILLERLRDKNPCPFPTGSWCSWNNSFCLCTGIG